jgi:hypothetical protein
MIGGRSRDRERFPALQEEISEDPARYLDVDRIEGLRLARARIRGIDFFAVLRAWRAVERNLVANGVVSEHHRQQVMEWLDEREAELEEIGERDERVEPNGRTPSPAAEWSWPDRDGEYPFTNNVDAGRYAADGGEKA